MKTLEFKLYLTPTQEVTLNTWLSTCCHLYNRFLEHRIKAYGRRKESISLYQQQFMLTQVRSRNKFLRSVPAIAERDALRRVDRGMKAFFRRLKAGQKPGFPRFRSHHRYNSLEFSAVGSYIRSGNLVRIPNLGLVRIRGGNETIPKTQRILRIIRRASGWYGQVVVDAIPENKSLQDCGPIGVDVGLESFATMSDGRRIDNPRFYRKSEKRLRGLQRSVARKQKGSKNRRKAVKRLAKMHEKIGLQRRNFCHQHSTELVRKHPVIGLEKLNVNGMKQCRSFSKSIHDAGWSTFTAQLVYKAANAGRQVVFVNPASTSQECPDCGAIKKKSLSERRHSCACGAECHRDHASARVILARALEATGATRLRRDSASGSMLVASDQADPLKQENKRFT